MPEAPLLLGVDAGTSRLRALVFDPAGRVVGEGSRPTPMSVPRPGWAEHDTDQVWQGVVAAIRDALAGLDDPRRVRSVAVASIGESGVLVDGEGCSLGPIIAWYDKRTDPDIVAATEHLGFDAIYRTTGLCPDPTFTLAKLLWLKRCQPDVLARGRHWLMVSEFIAWKLSGEMACDLSLASRTMALDIHARSWSREMLGELGLPSPFSAIAPSGTRLGAVTADAATATGLSTDCVVGVGGHDHVCGVVAVGADRPGILLDSMGTAEAVTLILDRASADPAIGRKGLNQGVIQVDRPLYYVFAGLPTSAACVEWFRATCAGNADHATLAAEAETVAPGSEGVLFLPHLRIGSPPYPDSYARGTFLGLTTDHARGALFRAVLEGMAVDAAQILDLTLASFRVPAPGKLIAIGGSTRNHLLMAMKAAAYGRTLHIADTTETTCLGAALLGGLAAGLWPDLDHARGGLSWREREVEPDGEWTMFYRGAHAADYGRSYDAIRQINRDRNGTGKI